MRIGFCGVLALIFIYLKLTGAILWSWWWVLLPIWGPFSLVFGFIILISLWAGTAAGIEALQNDRAFKKRVGKSSDEK